MGHVISNTFIQAEIVKSDTLIPKALVDDRVQWRCALRGSLFGFSDLIHVLMPRLRAWHFNQLSPFKELAPVSLFALLGSKHDLSLISLLLAPGDLIHGRWCCLRHLQLWLAVQISHLMRTRLPSLPTSTDVMHDIAYCLSRTKSRTPSSGWAWSALLESSWP